MGRDKPTYVHRIHDDVYFIYKFSKYGSNPIKLVHAGKVFTGNNFSKSYHRLTKKYDLEPMDYIMGDTFSEFLSNLYCHLEVSGNKKFDLPPFAMQFLKVEFNRNEPKRVKEEFVSMIINQLEREKHPIEYNDETKKQIREIYNRLKL